MSSCRSATATAPTASATRSSHSPTPVGRTRMTVRSSFSTSGSPHQDLEEASRRPAAARATRRPSVSCIIDGDDAVKLVGGDDTGAELLGTEFSGEVWKKE